MSRHRRLASTALAAGLLVATSGAAQAAPAEPHILVAAAYQTVQCDPSGPTARDGQLVGTLNAQLTGKMRNAMTAYRVSCARMIIKAVRDRGLTERAAVISITTAIVESTLRNISEEVDHDSLGLFQQRASWGTRAQRLDPVWSTNAFLSKMEREYPNGGWQTAPIGEVCQAVQVSGYPARYQPEAADAQRIVTAVWPHVNGAAGHGPLWGRNRTATGAWDAHALEVDANRTLTATASAGTPDGRLHVINVVPGSGIWYRSRTAAGNWDDHATKIDDNGRVGSVALAARPNGTLDVFAVVPGSGVWQRSRPAGGAWAGSATKVDENGDLTAVAATALPNGTVRYAGLVAGSGIWTRSWTSSGGWDAHAVKVDDNVEIAAIALAALPNGTVHLAGVVPGSGIWHRGLTGGIWDAHATKIDDNGGIGAVALAGGPGNVLHLTGVVTGAGVWYRARTAAGAWDDHALKLDDNRNIFATSIVASPGGTLHVANLVDVS